MVLTDNKPRHRAKVTDAQVAEHEYRKGHVKFGRGRHEAYCYCAVSDMPGPHTFSHRENGGPYNCTVFIPANTAWLHLIKR